MLPSRQVVVPDESGPHSAGIIVKPIGTATASPSGHKSLGICLIFVAFLGILSPLAGKTDPSLKTCHRIEVKKPVRTVHEVNETCLKRRCRFLVANEICPVNLPLPVAPNIIRHAPMLMRYVSSIPCV